jgi:hypothetical protein
MECRRVYLDRQLDQVHGVLPLPAIPIVHGVAFVAKLGVVVLPVLLLLSYGDHRFFYSAPTIKRWFSNLPCGGHVLLTIENEFNDLRLPPLVVPHWEDPGQRPFIHYAHEFKAFLCVFVNNTKDI